MLRKRTGQLMIRQYFGASMTPLTLHKHYPACFFYISVETNRWLNDPAEDKELPPIRLHLSNEFRNKAAINRNTAVGHVSETCDAQ